MSGVLRSKLRRRAPRSKTEADDLSARLVTANDPAGSSAEAYRALRTTLLYAFVGSSPRVIVITSSSRHEGKTTTCANLGVVLAQIESSTLVVDCDLRKPSMHRAFGVRNLHGLVNVLMGEYDLEEVCHEPLPKLKLLTAGPIVPDPTELLGSTRFAEFMDQARRQFEYVLVDAPPIQAVSDPLVIARLGDGVMLVLDAQNTRKGLVRQSVRSLENVGARVLGTVMNNVQVAAPDYHYY